MIGLLTGTIIDAGKDNVLVSTEGGVGYLVQVTSSIKKELLVKKKATLYTHLAIKQNGMDLYGFATQSEYSVFLLMLTVSGVGPKSALSILSHASPEDILMCIRGKDSNTLHHVYGISKKQADKIILELSGKVDSVDGYEHKDVADIVMVLSTLGYEKKDIREVVMQIKNKQAPLEEQTQEALRLLRTRTS
ncbi:MAG: Holliday junction branch migration protein RuvA [Alphaproteobacteria bacterium]|nr:Holliday junction branch migration protein RuvA [Alphaproteobacteria bacterium]